MLKWFNNRKKKNNKGFTLVELVIVIAILAILVGLLAPQYTKYVEKSRKSADVDNLEEIAKAFQVACADVEVNVDAGVYKFTLVKGSNVSESNTSCTSLNDAMDATLGSDWRTSTKGKGTWTTEVSVTCEKKANGSVTVSYSQAVTDYSSGTTSSGGDGSTTTTTTA